MAPAGRAKRRRTGNTAKPEALPTMATASALSSLSVENEDDDAGADERTNGEPIVLTVALFAQRERYVPKVVGACFYANATAEARLLGRTGALDADADLDYMVELIHAQAIALASGTCFCMHACLSAVGLTECCKPGLLERRRDIVQARKPIHIHVIPSYVHK
jgi:hypothetical protein